MIRLTFSEETNWSRWKTPVMRLLFYLRHSVSPLVPYGTDTIQVNPSQNMQARMLWSCIKALTILYGIQTGQLTSRLYEPDAWHNYWYWKISAMYWYDRDVLLVIVNGHGGNNFKTSSENYPFTFLSYFAAQQLREEPTKTFDMPADHVDEWPALRCISDPTWSYPWLEAGDGATKNF